jgi:hypothetical protein
VISGVTRRILGRFGSLSSDSMRGSILELALVEAVLSVRWGEVFGEVFTLDTEAIVTI